MLHPIVGELNAKLVTDDGLKDILQSGKENKLLLKQVITSKPNFVYYLFENQKDRQRYVTANQRQ